MTLAIFCSRSMLTSRIGRIPEEWEWELASLAGGTSVQSPGLVSRARPSFFVEIYGYQDRCSTHSVTRALEPREKKGKLNEIGLAPH